MREQWLGALIVPLIIALAFFFDWLERRSPNCSVCKTRSWSCNTCRRCADRQCNAGCIYCRPREEWDPISRSINRFGEKIFGRSQ